MAAGDGLIVMTPTSIVVSGSGSSASINSNGGVDFASVTSLSLNGVFKSSFGNYCVIFGPVIGSTNVDVIFKLRLSGTDTTGSDYITQLFQAYLTYTYAERLTAQSAPRIAIVGNVDRGGYIIHLYGPGLAQPTAGRIISARDYGGAMMDEWTFTHSLSTAYDGFTLSHPSGTTSGTVTVFGYEE